MSGFSHYLSQKIIDHVLRLGAVSYSSPSSITLGLFTADPGDGSPTGEVAYSGYARQSTGAWAAVTNNNQTSNASTLTFPAVAGSSVTVSHWVLFDNSGNPLMNGAFSTAKTFQVDDIPTVSTGGLVLTID